MEAVIAMALLAAFGLGVYVGMRWSVWSISRHYDIHKRPVA